MKWGNVLLAVAAILLVAANPGLNRFWVYVPVEVVIIAMTGFIVKALEDIKDQGEWSARLLHKGMGQ